MIVLYCFKIRNRNIVSPIISENVITARDIVHENRILSNPTYETQDVDYNIMETDQRHHNGIYNSLYSV